MKKNFWQSMLAASLILFSIFSYAGADMNDQKLAAQLNQTWNALFNKGDVTALSQLYSAQAVLSPGNGQVLQGQKAIAELFTSFVEGGVHNHTIEVVESHRDGDLLYQVSHWQAEGKAQEGVTPKFGGIVTLISKLNAAGEWKLQVHSWNVEN